MEELKARGHSIIPECAREFKKAGILPQDDPVAFESLLLATQFNREYIIPEEKTVFIDGGYVDMYAFSKYFGVSNMVPSYPFMKYDKFFILDRLPTHTNDDERNESKLEAEAIHGYIIKEAIDSGYDIVSVPVLPVKERVDFIIKEITKDI